MRNTASDGRVIQILRRAEAAGLLDVEARAAPWSARRITIKPLMRDLLRGRTEAEIDSASLVVPAIRPALARLADDSFVIGLWAILDRFDGMAQPLRGPANHGFRGFMVHEAGLSMLYDLLLRQSPTRARLLEEAPFSKARLATRFSLSRRHVGRVFAGAVAGGHVCFQRPDRIAFSPSLS